MNQIKRVTFTLCSLLFSGATIAGHTDFAFDSLQGSINPSALKEALHHYKEDRTDSPRMVIVDFSLPSEKERFYVVNILKGEIERQTLVAHATNSGYRKPTSFSNTPESNMSSTGLFRTGKLYYGKNGLSLRIDGLDRGKNDNARSRFIVIHGSTYAEKSFYDEHGMLGRSKGCFAIPMSEKDEILPSIAENTLMYVYSDID
jgi:hypothetical protein